MSPRPVAKPSAEEVLEERFARFRDESAAFVRSLSDLADFRANAHGAGASELNLRVARSVFSKWSLDILILLHTERRLGFGDLRKALPWISSRVLSTKLKRLETHGLVHREVLPTRPPRVEYRLTDRGYMVTKLGEPVLLYLRASERLYRERVAREAGESPRMVGAGRPGR